jgi:diacylglycerol kinase family enzyme
MKIGGGKQAAKAQAKRIAVIYYPGRVDRKKLAAAVDLSSSRLDFEPTLWLPTSADEPGGEQALRAIAQGATHLLVVGGDGTAREVFEAISHAGLSDRATVGIVPGGTGNVLARHLQIDLNDMRAAVDRAITGNRHPIDLGLARIIFEDGKREEKYFSVMAGMGLDAKIMQKTDPKLKKAFGWVAYIDGGIKALPTIFERMTVSVDSRDARRLKVVTIIVGNVGWLPGNITLMPSAALDDGILDVAVVGPRRFWNWIDFWGRVTFLQAIRENRQVRHLMDATANVKTLENLSGKKIRITPEQPVYIQLDGDPMGKVLEVEFEVQPRAVTIRS